MADSASERCAPERSSSPGWASSEDASELRIMSNVTMGRDVVVRPFVNLYDCVLDDGVMVGPFVEIQTGVRVGRRSRIQSHAFVCTGVTIGADVFIGHGVMFVNDHNPRIARPDGSLVGTDFDLLETTVQDGASIGSGAIIMGGIAIGAGAMIGAGAVVTDDVDPRTTVAGVPARLVRSRAQAAR